MAEANLIFFDTDVLINWLSRERESRTGKPLWPAVEEILKAIQSKKVKGATSIISIMELRSFLRVRTKIAKAQIEKEIIKINGLLNILVPNDITMLSASQIQTETNLRPIDSIQVAIVHENLPATLVSRDKELLSTSKNFVPATTPEELLSTLA